MTRVLSGALLLVGFGGAAWWAPAPWLLVLALAVVVLAAAEYCALAGQLGARVPALPTTAAAAAVCASVAWPGVSAEPVVMAVVLIAGLLGVARGHASADSLSYVAASAFGPLYIGLPLGALIAIHWMYGREAALLLIAVVVVSDTAQYYAGRTLGRRALAPALSPKKTVEGAAGGLIAGSLTLAVVGHWWWPAAPVGLRATLGAVLVLLGMCGDLFESMLKRGAGVKDSSALIPGHGGVLDRIDALLFATPVYYGVMRHLADAA